MHLKFSRWSQKMDWNFPKSSKVFYRKKKNKFCLIFPLSVNFILGKCKTPRVKTVHITVMLHIICCKLSPFSIEFWLFSFALFSKKLQPNIYIPKIFSKLKNHVPSSVFGIFWQVEGTYRDKWGRFVLSGKFFTKSRTLTSEKCPFRGDKEQKNDFPC